MSLAADTFVEVWRAGVDVLMPPRCAACAALVDDGALVFCAACDARLVRTEAVGDDGVTTLFAYDGPVRDAVRRAKFGPDEATARALARLVGTEARARGLVVEREAQVTYVPAHWRRRLTRRFDLPEVLSRALAQALGVERISTLRSTRHASSRASGARDESLEGRYVVEGDVAGRTLWLVDDVVTTGATLSLTARLLRDAGAEVRCFALARTEKRVAGAA